MTSRCLLAALLLAAEAAYTEVCEPGSTTLSSAQVSALLDKDWNGLDSQAVVNDANNCLNALSTMQTSKHDAVMDERKEIAVNLIASIANTVSTFKDKKNAIKADADTLKSEAERLAQQLKNRKDQYVQQMSTVRSTVDGVRDTQLEAAETEKKAIREYFTTLRDQIKTQKDAVLGTDSNSPSANPVTREIASKKVETEDKLGDLHNKINKLTQESSESVEEFQSEVEEDSGTVETMIDGFNNKLQQSEASMSTLKSDVDEESGKTTDLMESLDQEIESREAALAHVQADAKTKDEAFITSMENGELAQTSEDLQAMAMTAKAKTDQYVEGLQGQTSTLESDVGTKLQTLDTKKDSYLAGLDEKVSSAEGTVKTLADDIITEADKEKSFPRKAENELAKMETKAMDQFNDVRQESIDFFKDLNDEYLKKSKELGDAAVETLDSQVTNYVDADKKTAGIAEAQAQKAATEAVDNLIVQKQDLSAVQEAIGGLNEQADGVDSRIKRLDAQIKRTTDIVSTQMEANKKKIELDAKKVAVAAEKQLSKLKRKITTADKGAKKVLARAEKEMSNDFDTTSRKLQRKLDKEMTRTRASRQKVEALGKRMGDKMALKSADISRKINVVLKALPKVKLDVGIFKQSARNGIDSMTTEADTAIRNADEVVDEYLGNLQGVATAAVTATKDAVKPLQAANLKRFTDAQLHFRDAVYSVKNTTKGYVDAAEDELADAEQKVKENQAALEDFPQNTGDAYTLAETNATQAASRLNTAIGKQQQKLLSETGVLSTEVGNAVSAVSTRATEDMETADQALLDEVSRTATVVSEHLSKLKDVEAEGKEIEHKSDHLDRHAMILHGMLQEAEQKAAAMEKEVGGTVGGLTDEVAGQTAASEAADAAVGAHMDGVYGAAQTAGNKIVDETGESLQGDLAEGQKQMGQDISTASGTVNTNAANGKAEIESFDEQSGKQVTTAATSVADLDNDVQKEKASERKTVEEITEASNAITTELQEQSDAFGVEMQALGSALQAAIGGDGAKLDELMGLLTGIKTDTTAAVTKQASTDRIFLEDLLKGARDKLSTVQDRVGEAEKKAVTFAETVEAESKATDASMASAETLRGEYEQKVAEVKKTYVEKLGTERRSRQEQTQEISATMKKELEKSWTMMQEVERVGSGPMGIIGPAFDMKVGKLSMQEEKLDRQLRKSIEMEQYQDFNKLRDVGGLLHAAETEEAKITNWRSTTEKNQKAFQDMVVGEFQKLGVMVDLSELDMARAKAEEEWAVQEQMRHLKTALGDEMRDLSQVAESRLAGLAARSGKEIAELMKNEKLTAEERATELARIKGAARQRSQEIVEQDGHMKLEQDTMQRKLTIASDEVEQFMTRIASLEGHAQPGGQLKKVMSRIKGLLDEANVKAEGLGGAPSVLAELGDASVEREAELRAGLHALQGADPAGLLQVAADESARMLTEDRQWKGELAQLPRALS